jgi:uncharacterized protein (TIGR02001 family)
MKLMTKTSLLLAAMVSTTAAMAQTAAPAPDYTLAFNVGAVSDYRYRGIAQTSFKPAIQAGVDFSHKSGVYAGAWVSNVNWIKDYVGATEGATEVDLYGGYKGEIAKDLGFDVGLITYQYPSNTADKAGYANANTTEIYGALTYGIVTAKYSHSTGTFMANNNSSGSGYFELAAGFDLGNGMTLTPHIGRQVIPGQAGNAGDYTDFSLTFAKDFGNGLVATASAIGTDAKDSFYKVGSYDNLGRNALVVGLKYSF